jgi:hypothetical protein
MLATVCDKNSHTNIEQRFLLGTLASRDEETTPSLRYLLNTSDFCGLEPLKKAVKLVNEHHVGQRIAARLCDVTHKSLHCALDASKKGCPLGQVGRPKLLNPEQELALVTILEEANDNRKGLTFGQFQNVVCTYIIYSSQFTTTYAPISKH